MRTLCILSNADLSLLSTAGERLLEYALNLTELVVPAQDVRIGALEMLDGSSETQAGVLGIGF